MTLPTFCEYFPARRDRVIARAVFMLIALLAAPAVATFNDIGHLQALGRLLLIAGLYELYILPALFLMALGRP